MKVTSIWILHQKSSTAFLWQYVRHPTKLSKSLDMSHDSRHLFYYYYYDKNGIRSFHFLEEATGQQLLDTRRWFFSLAIVESDEKKRCQIGTRFMYHKLGPRHWFDFFSSSSSSFIRGASEGCRPSDACDGVRRLPCGRSAIDPQSSWWHYRKREHISICLLFIPLLLLFFFQHASAHNIIL